MIDDRVKQPQIASQAFPPLSDISFCRLPCVPRSSAGVRRGGTRWYRFSHLPYNYRQGNGLGVDGLELHWLPGSGEVINSTVHGFQQG